MYKNLSNLNIIYCDKSIQNRESNLKNHIKNTYILNSEQKAIKFFSTLYKTATNIDAIIYQINELNDLENIDTLLTHIRDIDDHVPIIINHICSIDYKTSFNVTFHFNPDNNIDSLLKKIQICVKNHKRIDNIKDEHHKLEKHLSIFNDVTLVSKTDLKGVITYVNDAFCESTGFTRDELIGQPHNVVRHPEMRKEIFADMWKIIQQGQVWQGKIKSLSKNNETYWVKATIFPIFDETNNIVEYISIRFLTTEDEHKTREVRKKNLKMIVKNRYSEYSLKRRIAELEQYINSGYLTHLERKSKELEEKNDSLRHQIKILEQDLRSSKNNESNSVSNTVSRFRNIQKDLHTANNKCKALENTIHSQKKEISKKEDQIVKLETKIHDLTNQIRHDNIELELKDVKLRNIASSHKKKKSFLAS